MNILVIGKFYTEGFALHIAETLFDMGHEVYRYEPGLKTSKLDVLGHRFSQVRSLVHDIMAKTESYRQYRLTPLVKLLKSTKIDLTIVCHDFLTPSEAERIKELTKSPLVLWHPDHIANCGKFMFLNAPFDALFFKDPYIVNVFRSELNKNTFYLPECCNPVYHKPQELSQADKDFYGCDITTAGNLYPNRVELFKQLTQYKVKIWGSPPATWIKSREIKIMQMGRHVLNEDKAKAFGAAKIVLNNLFPAEVIGINVRAFEIPACGGFELISWRPGLNQLLEDGKEIVSYKNFNDMIDKIDYYLDHENERNEIVKNGFFRVTNNHTYELRLNLLLSTVFKNKTGYEI